MYTVKQIKDAIEQDYDGSWNEFLELIDDDGGTPLESLGTYAQQVAEGGESRPWIVFKVGEQYFEINGAYNSWEGTEWDGGLQEVEPFDKTITAYRSVKP